MYLIIVLVIISVIVSVGKAIYDHDIWEGISSLFLSAILVLIFFVIFSAIVTAMVGWQPVVSNKTVNPLVSLQDGSTVSGTFSGNIFVSSGSINQVPSFTFYIKSDGLYQLETIAASKAQISEENRTDGYLETIHYHSRDKIENWYERFANGRESWNRYIFHIPKGSISRNIQLGPQPTH